MASINLHKWIVTPRQRCDLEMLLTHGFAPLYGFLSEADYEQVLHHNRLLNQSLWPMPITLDVTADFAHKLSIGQSIHLYDRDATTVLAVMTITDIWHPNKQVEAEQVYGTQDLTHPGVNYLFKTAGDWYLGGPVQRVAPLVHTDFNELRLTPQQLKSQFLHMGWDKIVGFQTRNPIHRAHMELTLRAAKEIEGHILLHPVVGLTKAGDIDYVTRVRCYQKILPYYPKDQVFLALLPLAMRMAGPKEALWHALIRKNYGCTHFIIGRDHAGPGHNAHHQPFYDPDAAKEFVLHYANTLGIHILPFNEMMYVKERKSYALSHQIQSFETAMTISGTQLREALLKEKAIPHWFSFPEVIQELRLAHKPKYKQGLTLFFTGLSGSGKTTLAQALKNKMLCYEQRSVTLLDGDLVRELLGDKLGYSPQDRNLNINLISFIAAEVTKAGGIAICAVIAPYQEARKKSRDRITMVGNFVEIYNKTPLEICEIRDPKKLYAKARRGEIKNMTGIDDQYEVPDNPEIQIDTSNLTIDESVDYILKYLVQNGYALELNKNFSNLQMSEDEKNAFA